MKQWNLWIFVLVFSVCLVGVGYAEVTTNEAAPDFSLMDTKGETHQLSDYQGKYVVLEWTNYECPFVVKHYASGNMQGLQEKFTEDEVVWFSINSSAEGKQGFHTSEEINRLMEENNVASTAYLLDNAGEVGRMYGAKTTPHIFIISPEGRLIYQGAIDDTPSFDAADIPFSKNYVDLVLNSSMKGESTPISDTKSYGCSVKY